MYKLIKHTVFPCFLPQNHMIKVCLFVRVCYIIQLQKTSKCRNFYQFVNKAIKIYRCRNSVIPVRVCLFYFSFALFLSVCLFCLYVCLSVSIFADHLSWWKHPQDGQWLNLCRFNLKFLNQSFDRQFTVLTDSLFFNV